MMLLVKWILLMLDKKLAGISCKAALILITEQAHRQDYPAGIENNYSTINLGIGPTFT